MKCTAADAATDEEYMTLFKASNMIGTPRPIIIEGRVDSQLLAARRHGAGIDIPPWIPLDYARLAFLAVDNHRDTLGVGDGISIAPADTELGRKDALNCS